MREAYFAIVDISEECYKGYTDGRLWNGWATPMFEFEAATRVMDAVNEGYNSKELEEEGMTYDISTDTFFYREKEDLSETRTWTGFDRDGKHLYDIGAFSWIWDEVKVKIKTDGKYYWN